jgi:hypothetical protein
MLHADLKRWMDRNGKTPVQVAAAVGSTQRTIERTLAHETEPSPMLAAALIKLMEENDCFEVVHERKTKT